MYREMVEHLITESKAIASLVRFSYSVYPYSSYNLIFLFERNYVQSSNCTLFAFSKVFQNSILLFCQLTSSNHLCTVHTVASFCKLIFQTIY